jgi:hypothetical protein
MSGAVSAIEGALPFEPAAEHQRPTLATLRRPDEGDGEMEPGERQEQLAPWYSHFPKAKSGQRAQKTSPLE